jgi:acetylornithine deacetylase/succinyl-diaminopimelate desuccinylase-like protein
MRPASALRYAQANRDRFVSELKQFLRFPSVSSQPAHAEDMRRCAQWLGAHLKRIGMDGVRIIPTPGPPIVYAESQRMAGRPTILLYGHYDVLPGDPLKEWRTSPFRPAVLKGNIYARGASDDKGQLFAHIKAVESYLQTQRSLPVNLKCIFEGEEEIGSPHLTSFIARNRRALRADAALISDTRMLGPRRPAISYAQRGGLRAELEILGPPQELHSGNFGGAIHNPLQVLCEIIASIHDDHGRIRIQGFYDDVRLWDDAERESMRRTGPSDEQILSEAKVQRGWGESGFSLYERTTTRPALTVNGISGGHRGRGAKSIIPARATAKMSFRLVPDQNPDRVAELFRRWVEQVTPSTVRSNLRVFSPIEPALLDRAHPAMRTAARAYQIGFGARPVFVRSGGSIPVVNTFQRLLGIPTVLMGFGLPGDRIHAPNERFSSGRFQKAIVTSLWFLALARNLAARRSRPDREMEEKKL